MQGTFKVCAKPDAGEFADGDKAALAWDILHRTAGHDVPAVVDLTECVHLKPYAIACLCGLAALANKRSQRVSVLPPNDAECAQHLARLGLPRFFSNGWPAAASYSTNISINQIHWPPGSEGERIVDVLASQMNLPTGMYPRMVEGLDEIILNALTHAASPVDCIVAGQAFPNAAKVEVAVLDLGRTIRGHLTCNPRYADIRSDGDAIQKAMEEGVTGTPAGQRNIRGEQNSGAGLAYVREYCEGGGGELTVLSGDTWVTCGPGSRRATGRIRGNAFQGCLVNIRYLTGSPLPCTATEPIL